MNSDLPPHAWAKWENAYPEIIEMPEFILDDVIVAGTVVIAGERGLGKTSTVIPMMLSAAGLCPNFPMQASIPRKVIYVTEDPDQVRRIIAAMAENGDVINDPDSVNESFKLVSAVRLRATEIVRLKPHIEEFWTNHQMTNGQVYCTPPVVVLDTTNATIDLDNISDNSEVSKAVSTLRNGFRDIPLVLVGHVSKATRTDARQLSFVGAGAWEGDTQQSLYVASNGGDRHLILGKSRFSPEIGEYLLHGRNAVLKGLDRLGRESQTLCYYSVPEPISEQRKSEITSEKRADLKRAEFASIQKEILRVLNEKPGANTGYIKSMIHKRAETVNAALDELLESGRVKKKKPDSKTKIWFAEPDKW
ncbi:MAG: Uncharacterised protein [Gammaproteobacteria bacterium]|nr:MAG: Uncharacterised protein [Gammaproteobacteria bacterium]